MTGVVAYDHNSAFLLRGKDGFLVNSWAFPLSINRIVFADLDDF